MLKKIKDGMKGGKLIYKEKYAKRNKENCRQFFLPQQIHHI
jgi:hypothetical protein